jgi:hypothetical protein
MYQLLRQIRHGFVGTESEHPDLDEYKNLYLVSYNLPNGESWTYLVVEFTDELALEAVERMSPGFIEVRHCSAVTEVEVRDLPLLCVAI